MDIGASSVSWFTVHISVLPLSIFETTRLYSDVTANVLSVKAVTVVVSVMSSVGPPSSSQVTLMVPGRKPEDEHVARVVTCVSSTSGFVTVTDGAEGRTTYTIFNIVFTCTYLSIFQKHNIKECMYVDLNCDLH